MYRPDRSDAPAPIGAIRKRQEIIDLVIEARKGKKAIRVWTVTQSGYLSCFYIYSGSRLHKPNDKCSFYELDCINDHSPIGFRKTNERWFKSDILTASYNIEEPAGNCHYAFTSKIAAQRYSDELKNDARYIQSVKEWHSYCRKMDAEW